MTNVARGGGRGMGFPPLSGPTELRDAEPGFRLKHLIYGACTTDQDFYPCHRFRFVSWLSTKMLIQVRKLQSCVHVYETIRLQGGNDYDRSLRS